MVGILLVAPAASEHVLGSDWDKPNKDVWIEATVMTLRQDQDEKSAERLQLMATYVSAARQPGSTPETVRSAVTEALRRLEPPSGQAAPSANYTEVLQLLGAQFGEGPLKAARWVGLLLNEADKNFRRSEDLHRAHKWRVQQEAMDGLFAQRLERRIVAEFATEMTRSEAMRAIAVRSILPPQASRPDDSVSEIMARHPKFQQIHLLMDTKDAVERNRRLVDEVKMDQKQLGSDLVKELEIVRKEVLSIGHQLQTESQRHAERARESEALRVKLEGFRGAAYVASVVIGMSNPDLAQQVSGLANASIGVYEIFDRFKKVIDADVSGKLTAFAVAALTGDILEVVMPVIALFIDTGPTVDQKILEAVQDLREQVHALHEEMTLRFGRVDEQLRAIARQLDKGLAVIADNQWNMQQELTQIRMSLDEQDVMMDYLHAELMRQTQQLEEWLRALHILPCLVEGDSFDTMSRDRYQECRSTIAALPQSGIFANAQKSVLEAEQQLLNFREWPDDMTMQGFRGLHAASPRERDRLPDGVVGFERLVRVLRIFDKFLLRWPEHIGENDLQATSRYARTMRAHLDALRLYTEALRNELFRYANPYPSEEYLDNAFARMLDAAAQAIGEMMSRVAKEVRVDRENHDMYWRHDKVGRRPRRRHLRDLHVRPLTDSEIEEIVDGGKRGGLAGRWDISDLREWSPSAYPGGQRAFLQHVMREVQDGLRGNGWRFGLMLLREGLLEIQMHHFLSARKSDDGNPRVIVPWNERRDSGELRKNRHWKWRIDIDKSYEFLMVIQPQCDADPVEIDAEHRVRVTMDVWLDGEYEEILEARDNWDVARMADYAAESLGDELYDYGRRRRRELRPGRCREEVKAIFNRDRQEGSRRITQRLSQTEEWRNWNSAIDLSQAYLTNWLRLLFHHAAEQDTAIFNLLRGPKMVSPERLMREGLTLWDALKESQRQIEVMRDALRRPAIVKWLKTGYGHQGVMTTRYLGVDPVPSPEVALQAR